MKKNKKNKSYFAVFRKYGAADFPDSTVLLEMDEYCSAREFIDCNKDSCNSLGIGKIQIVDREGNILDTEAVPEIKTSDMFSIIAFQLMKEKEREETRDELFNKQKNRSCES